MTPKRPTDDPPEERGIVYSGNAAKELQVIKISQRNAHKKILGVIDALQEFDFPPNVEIKKMHWQIHGKDVWTARVKGHTEYRIIFQLYPDHVRIDEILSREQFEKRTGGYGR